MPALLDNNTPYLNPALRPTVGAGVNPYAGFIQRYLASDPTKLAQFQGIDANVASQLTGYDEQGYQNMINYGMIPKGYDVPAEVRLAAERATKEGGSGWAKLADAYHNQRSAAIGTLGASGFVRSSQFGAGLNQDARAYNVSKYDAENTLTNALYGLKQQGLQAQQEGITQKTTSEKDALDRLYTMIQNGMISLPPTGTAGAGAGGAGRAAPMKPYPQVAGYNPYGYVPGGSSPAVSSAITARALKGPLYGPTYNPRAYVPGGTSPNTATVIQQRGAHPQAYPTGFPSEPGKLTPHGRSPYAPYG